ncbi:hypothetical protein B0H10DRAFT_1977127 [Mycena sp. CBHHK59/15]|nr:hypothetical protein B0H10DRAFT_1977127 [Mycena sp. CBHHK59/15]
MVCNPESAGMILVGVIVILMLFCISPLGSSKTFLHVGPVSAATVGQTILVIITFATPAVFRSGRVLENKFLILLCFGGWTSVVVQWLDGVVHTAITVCGASTFYLLWLFTLHLEPAQLGYLGYFGLALVELNEAKNNILEHLRIRCLGEDTATSGLAGDSGSELRDGLPSDQVSNFQPPPPPNYSYDIHQSIDMTPSFALKV